MVKNAPKWHNTETIRRHPEMLSKWRTNRPHALDVAKKSYIDCSRWWNTVSKTSKKDYETTQRVCFGLSFTEKAIPNCVCLEESPHYIVFGWLWTFDPWPPQCWDHRLTSLCLPSKSVHYNHVYCHFEHHLWWSISVILSSSLQQFQGRVHSSFSTRQLV